MGANPMQKKVRNSMLTGLIIGLLIGLALCVILYFFLTSSDVMKKVSEEDAIAVYVLNKSVSSGTTIKLEDVTMKVMNKIDVPIDAVSISSDAVAKIDLTAGTILTQGMLNKSGETLTDDLRKQEYNMITLPSQLSIDDFIDIRLQLPNGGDYVVVSKKKVIDCNSNTIWLNMYEEEIELMSNAIIEYYIMAGSKLYATTYIDGGLQTAAVGTYVPNQTVTELINRNPNITSHINSARYSDALKTIRNDYIKPTVEGYAENALENIEKNMQDEIEALKQSRETYFGALNSAY